MAKVIKSQKDIIEHLKEISNVGKGLAKKIARANKTDPGNGVKMWDSLSATLNRLQKDSHLLINSTESQQELDRLFNKYQNALKRKRTGTHLDLGKTNWRKEEFYMYYIVGEILRYDPWDSDPAYFGGDINLKEYNMSIQIKSPEDKFRIYYSADKARGNLAGAGDFSEEFIEEVVKDIQQAFAQPFTTTALQNETNKIKFMEYYQKISRANWYVLFYESGSSISAVSLPSESLINFVSTFAKYFVPKAEGTKTAKGLAFLSFRLSNSSFQIDLWEGILSLQSAIHYSNADEFYEARNNYFEDDPVTIKRYNDQFWRNHGHAAIQNKFFAPIKYR